MPAAERPPFWINITTAANGGPIRVYFKAPDQATFGQMLDSFKRATEPRLRRYDGDQKEWRVHPSQRESVNGWSASWGAEGAEICRVTE